MRKLVCLVGLLFLTLSGNIIANEASDTQVVITNELTQLTETWNEGNLENFIKSYKNADTTRYINTATMVQGYKNILANYKSRFPTKEKMGKIKLSDIDIDVLSSDYAIATGKWHLKQGKKRNQGIFTLLFQNTTEGWKVVLDHTS